MKHLIHTIAQEKKLEKKIEKKEEKSKKKDEDKDSPIRVSETHHSVVIDGKLVRYTAKAGMYKMLDGNGKYKSHNFFVSYERDVNEEERKTRPITFAFNGGPGASSIWVHFGALGPKRVKMTDDGRPLPPPYKFEDNAYSWLDVTDLLFIDPVGTGYSGHPEDEDPGQFWGLKEDIESVGEFIRLYVTRNKRWLSPKFIAGESYGTTRAAGLTGHLQETLGMDINGIVLISSVLDFSHIYFKVSNDIPYVMFLPTYTATAWYHNKLSPRLQENLEKTLEEVEKWALDEYLVALAYGNSLPADKYEEVAEKLSEYTGLSKKYIKHANLRVTEFRFMKELLRDDFRTVGRLDSRSIGIDADAAGEFPEYDASFTMGPFVSTVNDYVRKVLKYENDQPYKFANFGIGEKWNWTSLNRIGYPTVADILRSQIHQNKYLNVLVTCGYYDLATPYYGMKYAVNQLRLDPSLRDNIELTYYTAGHMLYYPWEMLKKFKADIVSFYEKASTPEYRP